jgi:hypothetical protein
MRKPLVLSAALYECKILSLPRRKKTEYLEKSIWIYEERGRNLKVKTLLETRSLGVCVKLKWELNKQHVNVSARFNLRTSSQM